MTERFAQICLWADESISLCKELDQLLSRERVALITFKGDELAEIIMAKQLTVARILGVRKNLREAANKWYGVEDTVALESKLTPEQRDRWQAKHLQWQEAWKETCKRAERNQEFLKHSQRNLGLLVEHWRRQLGETPLYSAKGHKVDLPSTGKVFEAKF